MRLLIRCLPSSCRLLSRPLPQLGSARFRANFDSCLSNGNPQAEACATAAVAKQFFPGHTFLMSTYDLICIGAGPTGLACAIEAKRAGMRPLVIDKGCLCNSLFH